MHRSPWCSGSDGGLSIPRMGVRDQVTAFFSFNFFLLLLLQCDFIINLMPYSVSPTIFTSYDAQASSALILHVDTIVEYEIKHQTERVS